jgi:hypothetical protein
MIIEEEDSVVRVFKTGCVKIASRAPSLSIQSRKEGLYVKNQPSMRTWEPADK